jgi:hypothetical protein
MAEMHTDYDIKGFIQDLKDNNVPEDEIKGYIQKKFGDQTTQLYFPSKDAMTLQSEAPKESEMLTAPVAAGLGALGTAVGGYAVKKLRDRFIGGPKQEPAPKVEPTFGPVETPTAPASSLEKQLQGMDVNKLPKDQRELVNTLLDAERKRAEKQKQATTAIRQEMKGIIPIPQSPIIQPPAPQPVTNTVVPGAVAPNAPAPAISNPEVPTVADLSKQATGVASVAPPVTTTEIATEATEGKKKGRPTKEAQAKSMEGLTFRSDLGPGDNWLYNSFGAEGRKAILQKYNEGKPAGSYENSQRIFARMQEERVGPGRSELPRDIAKERGVPPPETNYGKLGKTAKMAGIAGLALTAQQAAQAKDLAQLRRLLGEAVLPLSATPSEVQPGTLGPEQIRAFAEAQKLGSPYRSVQPPR